jgi:predicted GIY-YIG superfamily endonuclease
MSYRLNRGFDIHHVYIIRNGKKGGYKIGVARDVEKRRDSLQTGNPVELYIVAKFDFGSQAKAYQMESALHKMFKRHRIRGEWFDNRIRLARVDAYFKTNFVAQKKAYKKIEHKRKKDSFDRELDLKLIESMGSFN